ncbi:hypothetical protein M0R04_13250 [Candidatus Dojkabacteria bacterium]|jgi:hypothetical protein|nr:hypothetical protein [Candidatus Dojkabacteria bacterium]
MKKEIKGTVGKLVGFHCVNVCIKCNKNIKETDEVAFIEGGVLCDKCWKKQPYIRLKNIK